MIVETFPVGPLGCNCSILVEPAPRPGGRAAIVVDPGGDFPKIKARLDALDASVKAIVHTHTHIDHVGATAALQRLSGAPARIHEEDRFLYELLPVQAAMIGCPLPEICELDGDLVDGGVVQAGGLALHVLHTPGHTPGSVCFFAEGPGGPIAFAGDTLFRRSIGRTDLWGGDGALIGKSIREKLYTLDAGTKVVTGHGLATTIGEERLQNQHVRAR